MVLLGPASLWTCPREGVGNRGVNWARRACFDMLQTIISTLGLRSDSPSAREQGWDLYSAAPSGWLEHAARQCVAETKRTLPKCSIAMITFDEQSHQLHRAIYSDDVTPSAAKILEPILRNPEIFLNSSARGTAAVISGGLLDAARGPRSASSETSADSANIVAFVATERQSTSLLVCAWRGKAQGAFEPREVAAVDELGQLVFATLRIGNRRVDALAGSLSTILENAGVGLIVIDDRLQIMRTNPSGDSLLRSGDHLQRTGNRLRISDPLAEARGLRHLRDVHQDPAESQSSHVSLFLNSAEGRGTLQVGISVLRPAGDMLLGRPLFALTAPRRDRSSDIGLERLLKTGLTKAEAELAKALLSGQTIKDYAEAKGISVATARVHLKHAMLRVGVHRQSELVRTLLDLL